VHKIAIIAGDGTGPEVTAEAEDITAGAADVTAQAEDLTAELAYDDAMLDMVAAEMAAASLSRALEFEKPTLLELPELERDP